MKHSSLRLRLYNSAMRFVILHHTGWPAHPDHFDLMLQFAEGDDDNSQVLRTFSTLADSFPSGNSERLREIQHHRRLYLTYQGNLSDDRGNVERVDDGNVESVPFHESLDKFGLIFRLSGHILCGTFQLLEISPSEFTFEKI